MTEETKQCQNCHNEFIIEPDDFAFYEKIKVPPPTWCPECRQRRRYSWRNENVLYRRNCDLCGKSTVTIYSPNKPYKVYCPPCWWSDKWNGTDYGRDFDFSKPFFPQFQELQLQVPRIALLTKNSVNSEYTNHSNNNKNCYLSFGTFDSEDVLYSSMIIHASKSVCDCYWIRHGGQLIYECIHSERCYQCQYGMLLKDCINCLYCYDLRGCSHCFLCSNLRNKQYYILNKQYTKEEYERKIKELNLGSFISRTKLHDDYLNLIRQNTLHRFAVIEKSSDVSGNMIVNSKRAYNVFEVSNLENNKYSIVSEDAKDSMDSFCYGFRSELIYETHALIHGYNVMFAHLCYDNSYLQYCDSCHNSENLFGCVGMKQGRYSIFNKQYSDNDYRVLREKVIDHMKNTKEYGEFFPSQLSPFGYNETQGQIHMPLGKEEALNRGYKWENRVPGVFGKETLKPEAIPDNIKDVDDSILKEALLCMQCGKNYNIVKTELDLYRHENIPIPRKCPDCRSFGRLALCHPRKLWRRKCQCVGAASENGVYQNTVKHSHRDGHCPNKFETSYSPGRPEIVYCESCYNSEVA